MNYELAKKLRDAGFPSAGPDLKITDGSDVIYWYPTLEELIEACGNDFYQLEQYQGNGEWVARAYVEDKIISTKFDVHNINEPDTVVALLWLMLNKK